jgi:hypothetical protein
MTTNRTGGLIMRKNVLSFILVLLAITTIGLAYGTLRATEPSVEEGAAQSQIGTWKLLSSKMGDQDVDLARLGVTLKHVTPTSFMWLSYDPETRVISRTAGGTYTRKGDKYEETPQYGIGDDFNGIRDKIQSFTLVIEGDRWHHVGALSNGMKIDEVWERCKNP